MKVEMPASFFVGYLNSVEASNPVATELPSPQLTEILLELREVTLGHVRQIVNRENNMLRLFHGFGPPLNLSLSVDLQTVGALRAAEQITAIGELPHLVASSALRNSPFRVAMVQFTGDFMQSLLV
jgi:hypothetical protein